MCQSYVRLPRLFTSLAVAGMLGFGGHAAVASPAVTDCQITGPGSQFHCTVGAAGDSYCDTQCKQIYGPDSVGECFGSPVGSRRCCLCAI
jgi:hypothetical protein